MVNTLEGIIPRPARLPGLARWQAVTAVPRSGVGSVAWSKQGQIIAADNSHQRFYDAASLELRRLDRPGAVTVSSDGQTVACGNRNPARLSAADGQSGLGNALPTLRGPLGWTIHAWTLTLRGKGTSPTAIAANAKPTASDNCSPTDTHCST